MKDLPINAEAAETVALGALRFLAGDGERLGRFLALSGAAPQDLPAMMREPGFLGGVLDHMLHDETLLTEFADAQGLAPETIRTLRARLPGQDIEN